jgi:MraZ protein
VTTPRFFGRYEHSIDAKGRVILPARFRPAFEHGGYLAQHLEGCLALWTPESFEEQMIAMEQKEALGTQERNLSRVWAAGCHEVEVDRQGRMMIPGYLREFAGLNGDVLVVGAIKKVEIWDPMAWRERVAPAEAQLLGNGNGSP